MNDINTKVSISAFFSEKTCSIVGIDPFQFFVFVTQKAIHSARYVFLVTGYEEALFWRDILKRFVSVRARSETEPFPSCGKSIERTNDEIQNKQANEQPEPEGVVHIKEI